MIGTEILFLLSLFVVRSNSDCILNSNSATCTGYSFDSFTNIGENCQEIDVRNPSKAPFVVNKSKNQYLHMIKRVNFLGTDTVLISEYGFKDFVSLTSLSLHSSSIEALKSSWFLVNNNITEFDCSGNKLRTLLKSDLENLKKLEIVKFSYNLLESIEPHIFSEMTELRQLFLAGNKLKSIPTGPLPMLIRIHLDHNLIDVVPANVFNEMPELRFIYLHHNAIRKIEDGAFKDLNHLLNLYLSNNFIEEITEFTFSGIFGTNFTWLDLSSNKIRRIAPGAFKELPVLRYLYLSNNSINELNQDIFEGFDAERLFLDHNEIEIIGNNTFRGFEFLKVLLISDNKLSSLTAEMFGTNLPKLLLFSVRNNSIQQLDSDLFKFTPNIQTFLIPFNKLQFLPEDIFVPLKNLKELRMQVNLIEELTEGHIESLKSLNILWIEQNNLTFIPLNRDSFPNLKVMNFGGNPWQCACLDVVQEFLNQKNIKFIKDYYFDGQCPVCVPTYFKHCERNTDFARFARIPETYKDSYTEQCRIKYLSNHDNDRGIELKDVKILYV